LALSVRVVFHCRTGLVFLVESSENAAMPGFDICKEMEQIVYFLEKRGMICYVFIWRQSAGFCVGRSFGTRSLRSRVLGE
jgi:hypothetical protein